MKILVISAILVLGSKALPEVRSYAEIWPTYHHTFKNIKGQQASSSSSRILGGSVASPGEIPFQVAVIGSNSPNYQETFCGGVLLSNTVVLTAAHCTYDKIYFDVVLGTTDPLNVNSPGRVEVKTTLKRVHEQFDYTDGLRHDISLLILPTPITYTSTIQPILLPRYMDRYTSFYNMPANTSGWGLISDDPGGYVSNELLYAEVDVINNDVCVNAYGANNVPNSKMCISTAGGTEGPCHGDSGGPLYLKHRGEKIVVGTTSFGAKQGCASGYPAVYSRLSVYLDWIHTNGGPPVRP